MSECMYLLKRICVQMSNRESVRARFYEVVSECECVIIFIYLCVNVYQYMCIHQISDICGFINGCALVYICMFACMCKQVMNVCMNAY